MKYALAVLILALAIFALADCSVFATCPFHDPQSGTFTGERRMIDGHWFGIYRCPGNGHPHEFLVRCL